MARLVTNDERSWCITGRGLLDEEQPQEDAHGSNKWLCKAEMETRFGVRLTSAMLDNGNMKNMLCFATHSMDKDMRLHKRPNIVDETLGSTDTGMKLTRGTDCDNPLATEATCSRCRS